jgi:uncharacterized RDD family membrane protein YckC
MIYNVRNEFHKGNGIILARIKSRFFAFLIDWLVVIIIYFCILVIMSLFNIEISNINVHGIFEVDLELNKPQAFLVTFLKLLFGLLPVLYFAFSFYFFNGQTIGKYLLRIRVLSLYHKNLGLWHCIERSLGYFASALEFGFGFIQAFWNPNRMTLHDKIGETIVIERPVKKRK